MGPTSNSSFRSHPLHVQKTLKKDIFKMAKKPLIYVLLKYSPINRHTMIQWFDIQVLMNAQKKERGYQGCMSDTKWCRTLQKAPCTWHRVAIKIQRRTGTNAFQQHSINKNCQIRQSETKDKLENLSLSSAVYCMVVNDVRINETILKYYLRVLFATNIKSRKK